MVDGSGKVLAGRQEGQQSGVQREEAQGVDREAVAEEAPAKLHSGCAPTGGGGCWEPVALAQQGPDAGDGQ